ncbi:hypothetical protein CWO91_27390 [Bradyrhizobium genosp. SA-3]|nr:hypothetical protein CWO91_27390 [Bradyrhizobium genosp. SA-3]
MFGSFLLSAGSVTVSGDTQKPPHRHCEELLRRSNPDRLRGKILDCFAALAMTRRDSRRVGKGAQAPCPPSPNAHEGGGHASLCPPYEFRSHSGAAPTGGPPGGRCRKVSET